MTPITKIPFETESDAGLESIKDSIATQRALDYYLKPPVSQQATGKKIFQVSDDVSQEEALVLASDYLRCAIANAQSASEQQQGSQRDLLLSLLFLMEPSRQLLDKAIDMQQLPAL